MNTQPPRPLKALEQLLQQGDIWQARRGTTPAAGTGLGSGYPALDHALLGGWQPGNLVELSYSAEGCGELQLLLPLLAQLSQQPRWIIWIDPPHIPFPAALAAAGVDLGRILMVHSKGPREPGWVMEQALRSGGCSAVLGWLPQADQRMIRRLQLAASQQPVYGFLLRHEPSPASGSAAAYRLQLQPLPESTGITLLKRRQGWPLPRQALPLAQHRLLAATSKPGLVRVK